MPSEKTKKLLEGLGKITDSAPKVFVQEKFHSYTNRHYPNAIYKLPAIYDKSKRQKDEDGDEYIMIDRIYSSMYDDRLMQKNGTEHKGKLYQKRRLITAKNEAGEKSNFYSHCTMTADGRWFDNGGFPIDPPKQEDQQEEEEKAEIGFAKRELTEEEKAEQAKWKTRAESEMLKKLK